MAFGYNQQFTDKPEMWDVDGYAEVQDGYGTLKVVTMMLASSGSLTKVVNTAPSSVIKTITQTGNSTGSYQIFLNHTWNQLTHASFETVIPSGASPATLICQNLGNTVGNILYGPGLTTLQGVSFITLVPNTGVAGSLSVHSGLHFRLRLKRSSA